MPADISPSLGVDQRIQRKTLVCTKQLNQLETYREETNMKRFEQTWKGHPSNLVGPGLAFIQDEEKT